MGLYILRTRSCLRTISGVLLGVCACVTILMATSRTAASAHSGRRDSVTGSVQLRLSRLEAGQQRLEAAQQAPDAAETKLKYDEAIAEDKLEITQQQSLFGYLFTGDGPFLASDSSLPLIPSQSYAHMSDEIASAVATQPASWPDTSNPNGSMHYMFAPVFRSI